MLQHRVDSPVQTRSAWALADPLLTEYYDEEWGNPVCDEQGVFEALALQIFQSGLSWLTVLRKREALRDAFANFDPEQVALFDDQDIERLMQRTDIFRNRRKLEAIVTCAQATLRLRASGTNLAKLVWSYLPNRSPAPQTDAEVPKHSLESAALARELKARGFMYVGATSVFSLMAAIGVVDTHIVTSFRRGSSGIWNTSGTRAIST